MAQALAYLRTWAAKLRDEPKLLIQAAAQAQKAADRVLDVSFAATNAENEQVAA